MKVRVSYNKFCQETDTWSWRIASVDKKNDMSCLTFLVYLKLTCSLDGKKN